MTCFSIITIAKNSLKELERTYESINNQLNANYEWIVIDGDSIDGTREWLNKNTLVKRWVSEPDTGIYNAMNKGMALSCGAYLIFMNGGDCFEENISLYKCQKKIDENNFPSFIYGDSIDVSEDGKHYYRKAKAHTQNWKGMITQHQAMFFKKLALGDLIYEEGYKLSSDYAFISKFIKQLQENEILYLDFPVCKFSMGGLNESRRFDALKEDFNIRKKIIKLPYYLNASLYLMHYIHTLVKKTYPSSRFIKHKTTQ